MASKAEWLSSEGRRFAHWFANDLSSWAEIQPLSARLNVKPIELLLEARSATLSYDVGPEFCNYRGMVHGGIISTVLDDAAGVAAGITVGRAFRGTVTANISFLAPVHSGGLLVEARVMELREALLFTEASLTCSKGGRAHGIFTQSYKMPQIAE